MAEIRATPRNPILGLLADKLQSGYDFATENNPPVEMLAGLLGIPALQSTVNRLSYGEPLTTGRGMTTQLRPDTKEVLMMLSPSGAGAKTAAKSIQSGAKELSPKAERMLMDFMQKQGGLKYAIPDQGGIASQSKGLLDQPPLDTSYRGSHTAPLRDVGNTLDDLSNIFPDDLYSPQGWRYYGTGDAQMDKVSTQIIQRMRGNPNAMVTVYRAVPKGVKEINPGDWVTINPEYAKFHGGAWVDDGKYDVITKKVKASDIATDGNSIHEFGYSPLGNE